MRPLKFSFLFYASAVALGILAENFCPLSLVLSCLGLLLGALFWSIRTKSLVVFHPMAFYVTGGVLYSLCFSFGFLATQFAAWKIQQDSYVERIVDQKPYLVQYRILEKQKSLASRTRYLVAIEAISGEYAKGKAVVSLVQDTVAVGSVWVGIGSFTSFPSTVNLGQFDYASYLKNKGIERQLYLLYTRKGKERWDGFQLLMEARRYLQQQVQGSASLDARSKEVILALLLGDRSTMQESVVASFQRLGLMHVLAISGLHIGLVYAFLSRVTFFIPKKWRCFLIVLLLWVFVFLSGFSPSVFRVVFMFSLLCIARELKRKIQTLELVGLALFLSLLFEPQWLFDVGFQLSYVAVLGIVWGMPLFKKAYTSSRIINYFLGLCCVSLVAQCSVLPLQLYYFHSFSLTFLCSNVVVIPLIALSLILGLCFLLFGWVHIAVGESLAFLVEQVMQLVFYVLQRLDSINFLVDAIALHEVQVGVLVVGFLCLAYVAQRVRLKRIKQVVVGSVVLALVWHAAAVSQDKEDAFVIASVKKEESLCLLYRERQLTVLEENLTSEGILMGYRIYFDALEERKVKLQSVVAIPSHGNMLILSKHMPFYDLGVSVEVLYFREDCPVNFDRVLALHQPKGVIIGNAMGKWSKDRLKESCRKKNIPFHDIREKGYWSSQFL